MKLKAIAAVAAAVVVAAAVWVVFLRGGPPSDVADATDQIAEAVVSAPVPGDGQVLKARSTDTRAVTIGSGADRFAYNIIFSRDSWTNAQGTGIQRTVQTYEWASAEDEKTARDLRERQLDGKKTQGGAQAGVIPIGPFDDGERNELVCKVSGAASGGLLSQMASSGDFPSDPDDLWDDVEKASAVPGADDDTVVWNAWGTITAALKAGETSLSPEQRATATRALGHADSVSVIDAEEDPSGKPAIGLRLSLSGNSQDVWFDSETGWISQTEFSGNSDPTAAAGAPAGTAPQQSSSYVLVESSIVDRTPGDLKPAKAGTVRGSLRCAD